MESVARDVYLIRARPRHGVNAYLVGDVLVDSRTRPARRGLLRQLKDSDLSAHVLTHAHPDHFGASHEVCETFDVPLWASERDAHAVETAQPELPDLGLVTKLLRATTPMPKPHPVARRLKEGDEVGEFTVLDVPGHTQGEIALWRESDGTLIAGDVFWNMPNLRPPPRMMTTDPAANRTSMRRLAALRPATVLFGHGPPLRDPDRLSRIVEAT